VAFDIVIPIFTIAKVNAHRSAQSTVGYIIYRDSVLYFFLTAATNITVLIIEALGPDYNLIKPTAVPFATLITVTMSSRVFLNLKFNNRQEKVNLGLPVHSHVSSFGGGPSQANKYVHSVSPFPPVPAGLHSPFRQHGQKNGSSPDFIQTTQEKAYGTHWMSRSEY
jgi:hypothetical protein